MRIRARRIAVGVSEEQYNKINRLTDRSFFTKEQVLRDIILGYPIQEDRSSECIELIDHIDVYEAEGKGKNKTQRVVIHYNFVEYLEIPENDEPYITADTRQGVAIGYISKPTEKSA